MTTVAPSADLHQVMAGLDLLEQPLNETPAQRALASRLVAQAHAQGLVVQPREAQLVARLLSDPSATVGPVVPSPRTAGELLTEKELKVFKALPPVVLTPEERADRDRSRRDPARRRKASWMGLVSAVVGLGFYGLHLMLSHWLDHMLAIPTNGLLMFTTGLAMCGSIGLTFLAETLALACVTDVFWGHESSLPYVRQKALYRAQLDRLSNAQLIQVHQWLAPSTHSDATTPKELVDEVMRSRLLLEATTAPRRGGVVE